MLLSVVQTVNLMSCALYHHKKRTLAPRCWRAEGCRELIRVERPSRTLEDSAGLTCPLLPLPKESVTFLLISEPVR